MTTDYNSDDSTFRHRRPVSYHELLQMSREEASRSFGGKAWDIAHFTQLFNEALATTPEPPVRPLSVFVSYRWESEEHRAWVARFAHDLRGRGYDVYFDQDLQAELDQPMTAPELIRLIVRCNRFVMVLSNGYLERIQEDDRGATKEGWVWDEFQASKLLARLGRIKARLIVWRSGDLPEWVSEKQVWDFRDDARYAALVDKAFPRQFVNIIGVRADGTFRLVGPIERVRESEVSRRLKAEDKFQQVLTQYL